LTVIRYGCVIASERKYRRYAYRGIGLAAGEDPPVIELRDRDCLFRAYNEVLDRVAGECDVEALVLVHEDTEIRDADFEGRARAELSQERVAVVGAVGGVGVTDIDWWANEQLVGSASLTVLKPVETYGTNLLSTSDSRVGRRGGGEVDTVDGFLLVLSPWAIANLRFDEALGPGFHGYDADLCFQARELGQKVVVMDTDIAHHQDTLGPGTARESWKRAHVAFRRKWEERWPLPSPPWLGASWTSRSGRAAPSRQEVEQPG
jgi:hypothetical protein